MDGIIKGVRAMIVLFAIAVGMVAVGAALCAWGMFCYEFFKGLLG